MVQVHRSTASCHDSRLDENNLLYFDGASQSVASADCLLESSVSLSTAAGDGREPATANQGKENAAVNQAMNSDLLECPVCLLDKPKEDYPEIHTCHHRSCSTCLKQYFRIEIMESRVAIACPECSELFHPNDIKFIVEDDHLVQKYEDFMLRRVLAVDPDTRWCPAPDCGYAVIASGCASCPRLKCERDGCNTNFCYHCKQYWHPNQTCDAARAERSPNLRSVSVSYSQEFGGQNEIKSCPRCAAFIIKMDDESCNHMTCAVCEAHFCWLCLKEVSDLHYLSPSGCTFWGRKQWSRKKKILWQLGILVGAPVGITLVAGLAVPAMIIGIPVWVGKKIHYRYELASRRKRNLVITGSVAASIFAAPIIATVAVGIGVPILLTYIYGVVPISLCRSGGCGVTTTNSGGVRFEFDEDAENNTRGAYSYTGDNHSMETGPNVANPSIAPSIGDASLGMTNSLSASGSHMDRVGVLRDDSDRDSSSHRAMAGTSINGSLCSGNYGTQLHKLEVQADISEHGGLCERTSMGGESYNISLNDDASTKALAGSIVSPKDKDGVSVCSRLFDGNNAPLVYPEEVEEKDGSAAAARGGTNAAVSMMTSSSSASAAPLSGQTSSQQQRQTSSSCPTSPNLRKASSPTPADDNKSMRGKKCTRFMDQVPELDDIKGTVGSIGSMTSTISVPGLSMASTISVPGLSDDAMTSTPITTSGTPTFSTMSLTSAPSTSMTPALHSCHSLASEEDGSSNVIRDTAAPYRLGKKAESTSVLMDSAESRRFEMAGNHWKGDTRYVCDEGCSGGKHGGRRSEKDRGSQPINLSDISKMSQGMPAHHATGCHDLLSVVDTSGSERMLSDRASRYKLSSHFHSISSSSSSSMDDPYEITPSSRRFSYKHNLLTSGLEGVEEDLSIPPTTNDGGHRHDMSTDEPDTYSHALADDDNNPNKEHREGNEYRCDELTSGTLRSKLDDNQQFTSSKQLQSTHNYDNSTFRVNAGVSFVKKEPSNPTASDRRESFPTSHTVLGSDISSSDSCFLPDVEITTPSGKFCHSNSLLKNQRGDAFSRSEKSLESGEDNGLSSSRCQKTPTDSSKQASLSPSKKSKFHNNQKSPKPDAPHPVKNVHAHVTEEGNKRLLQFPPTSAEGMRESVSDDERTELMKVTVNDCTSAMGMIGGKEIGVTLISSGGNHEEEKSQLETNPNRNSYL